MNAKKLLREAWVGPALALLAVSALFAALQPDTFLRVQNLETMVRQTVVVGLAALGMTLVIVQGSIDLSVGSAVALTTVVVARALRSGQGGAVALAAGLAVATAAGACNGALVAKLRLSPFIATLGTMSLMRGAAKGLASEQKIDAPPRGLDAWMAPGGLFVPPGVWLTAAVAALLAVVLHRTRYGRHVVAVGSSERTAELCGVPVARVKITTFAVAGLLAGLAGIMEFSKLTVGDPTDSIGLELSAIAAVVIGGGSLAGGQGSIAGTLVGALLMTAIRTGSTHAGFPNWVQEIVTGAIILAAVWLDRIRSPRA